MIKSIKKKVLNENYNLHIFNLIIYKKFIKLCFKKEIAVNEKSYFNTMLFEFANRLYFLTNDKIFK